MLGVGIATFLNHPLGIYMVYAGLGTAGWVFISYIVTQNKVQEDFDSVMEQRAISRQMEEMRRSGRDS